MRSSRRRLLKIAAPWLAGLVLVAIGFWIWDSRNYPIPPKLNPAPDPFVDPFLRNRNVLQKSVSALQNAKEERFWNSLELNGTSWKATDAENGTVSTVRFTEARIFVDPAEVKIGIPFVNDTRYEMLDPRIFEAVIPVPGKEAGTAVPLEKRVSLRAVRPDGKIYLQTTAINYFTLERIQ